jgi:hypothetical protein
MRARQKLNAGYVNGAVMMAALVGWLTNSWIVFVLVLIVLLASAIGEGTAHVRLVGNLGTDFSGVRSIVEWGSGFTTLPGGGGVRLI